MIIHKGGMLFRVNIICGNAYSRGILYGGLVRILVRKWLVNFTISFSNIIITPCACAWGKALVLSVIVVICHLLSAAAARKSPYLKI